MAFSQSLSNFARPGPRLSNRPLECSVGEDQERRVTTSGATTEYRARLWFAFQSDLKLSFE